MGKSPTPPDSPVNSKSIEFLSHHKTLPFRYKDKDDPARSGLVRVRSGQAGRTEKWFTVILRGRMARDRGPCPQSPKALRG